MTQVELSVYKGSPLTWYRWIGEFKCLIHNTGLGPEQKLTVLANHLNPDDKRLLANLSGGEDAYKYALVTLKKVCGRRDLMRRAHKKEIYRIGLRNRSADAFYEFVLQIRPLLHEFHRLRETAQEDIIEDVCAKRPQEE